jgi:hypothetical protein
MLSCLAFLLLAPLGIGTAAAAVPDDPFPLERLWSFGPDGTEATDFNHVGSVALDQEDDFVYVLKEAGSEASLFRFDVKGDPVDFEGTNPDIEDNRIEGLETTGVYYANKIAVNSSTGAIYVAQPSSILVFEADGDLAEFTAGPGEGTSEIPGLGAVRGVAVDSNGSIYVSQGANTVSVFASTGAALTSFAATDPSTLSVATNGTVYVREADTAIKRFAPNSFPVSGSTTYSQSTFKSVLEASFFTFTGVDVDRVNGDVYVLEAANNTTVGIRRYDSTGALLESFGTLGAMTETSAFGGASAHIAVWGEEKESGESEVVKLYVGDWEVNSNPRSKVAAAGSQIIVGPPGIENTSALEVTADSARLRALVDPNTAETTYRFEYGLEDCAVSACTSVPLGGASAGAGEQPVEVSHSIFDLQPNTTYHYRILAENSFGPAEDQPDLTFTTQSLGAGFELIDSRVWEMVSPPDKGGAQILGKGGLIQAASDGEGLAYVSLGSIERDPEGSRTPEASAVLARRTTRGWLSRDIASPNQEVTLLQPGLAGEFKFFSRDLSRAILRPRGSTPLSPLASERTPYLREDGDPALYTPLLTGKEGSANVPPGTEFGGSLDFVGGPVAPIGATPDLDHIVLSSSVPAPLVAELTLPSPPNVLYLWSAGQLQPISELPGDEGGAMASDPSFGSATVTTQHAISVDGSRVFWGRIGSGGALYLRDTAAEESVRLDVKQAGATGAGNATPVFQGASADGTVVFFTDTRDLTVDASPEGRDLYRCDIPAGSPGAGCASLTNLSAMLAVPGESANVLGIPSGPSEDGTRIYFVARGVLDGEPNQYGDTAQPGEPNLYLWEEGEEPRFIARLTEKDNGTWGVRNAVDGTLGEGSILSTAVSPGGRYLAFMSQRSLSGYANADAATAKPVQEVFRYDSVSDDLDCLSCNPTGAAPHGEDTVNRLLINPQRQYDGVLVAAALRGSFKAESLISTYRPRVALDNGRVFFNAIDSLVPGDSNAEWDVYQWEPTGVGGCSASSGDAATARSAGGCVSLLSSGTGKEESAFLDASASGDDVFFLTPARLSVTDEDDEPDIYDARVDGVAATRPSQPDCQGEACRSAAAPPGDSVPGSATFFGPGNAKPDKGNKGKRCPKGKRKVRTKGKIRCVARKRPDRKGKAGQNRGTVR